MAVTIIAEAGVNHEQDRQQAEQLIDIAAEAGVDIFKTQTFRAEDLVTPSCPPAEYQTQNSADEVRDQLSMLKKLELPFEWHEGLKSRCEARGIEFLSTAFEFRAFDFLKTLALKRLKIPSGEVTNLPFIVYQAQTGLPMILSTGMADETDIRHALAAIDLGYQGKGPTDIRPEDIENHPGDFTALKGRVTILHCTSDYPVRWDDVHMRALPVMAGTFGLEIGYSDHTPGIVASLCAVALGATVIEKHYTISRDFAGKPDHPSPDHHASLEPVELKALVEGIRRLESDPCLTRVKEICADLERETGINTGAEHLETLLGDPAKTISPRARDIAKVAAKSLVAAQDIKEGDIFTLETLTLKRPSGGLPPIALFDLLTQKAARSYEADDFIEKN